MIYKLPASCGAQPFFVICSMRVINYVRQSESRLATDVPARHHGAECAIVPFPFYVYVITTHSILNICYIFFNLNDIAVYFKNI